MAAAAQNHKHGAHQGPTRPHSTKLANISSHPGAKASKIQRKTQVHHFLLFLVSIGVFRLAFILEQDRGRSHPLTLWEQLQGNDILVDGSVQVLETLDENLVADGRL